MTAGPSAAEADASVEPGAGEPDERIGLGGRGVWHLVAFLAALVLVLAMTIDWYTTEQGEEYRRVQEVNERSQDSQRLDSEDIERAAQAAETQEKNAFQADAFVDRLIMLICLVAFAAAVAAALMRSLGRRPDPPWRPSAIATVAGVIGTLLILYRMVQPPGLNDAAALKNGAPIGLAALGILTVASRLATLMETEERMEAAGVRVPEPESRRERRARRRAAPADAAPAAGPPSSGPPAAAAPPPPASAPVAQPPAAAGRLWAPDPADDTAAEERRRRHREREAAGDAREDRPRDPQRRDPDVGASD